jgi:hypothetical protein
MPSSTSRRGPIRVYKNRAAGTPRKAPRCICCFPASRAGQVVPLRYGVQLVLCEDHRDPGWIASRNGRDFLASVTTTMTSFGLSHRRYALAVAAFVREVVERNAPAPRHRPGSYAWPGLRAAGEAAWASGGSYHDGEAAVHQRCGPVAVGWRAPSSHTVRRWWREKRWLLGTPRLTHDAAARRARESSTHPADSVPQPRVDPRREQDASVVGNPRLSVRRE